MPRHRRQLCPGPLCGGSDPQSRQRCLYFPGGKNWAYMPRPPFLAPAATNAEYRAEYFRSSPPNRTNITAPGLVKVSLCEYWDIEEVGPGSPVVNVSLSWSGLSPVQRGRLCK